jgi:hypothetical protein
MKLLLVKDASLNDIYKKTEGTCYAIRFLTLKDNLRYNDHWMYQFYNYNFKASTNLDFDVISTVQLCIELFH